MNTREAKKFVGEKIKEGMANKGINKKQLAFLMDVPTSTINKWLSGNHNFTIETLFSIEEKLGIVFISKQ